MSIEPALRPEDWRAALHRGDFWYFAETEDVSDHSKAALYLHNQPFGFTHEDVDALADCLPGDVESEDDYVERCYDPAQVDRAYAALAKIKALLPPREG